MKYTAKRCIEVSSFFIKKNFNNKKYYNYIIMQLQNPLKIAQITDYIFDVKQKVSRKQL